MSNAAKIAEVACGLLIAGTATAAWRFWHINGFIAILGILIGLDFLGHAFEYKN